MFWKGWSVNKSLSPVIIQEAQAATASSRNLLSLGSRQVKIGKGSTDMKSACFTMCCNCFILSLLGKYLLNLPRESTSSASACVFSEKQMLPCSRATPKARAGILNGLSTALTSVLVSTTNRIGFGAYGCRKASNISGSRRVSLLIISLLTPSSANSMASSNCSLPVGYSSPRNNAPNTREVSFFLPSSGRLFHILAEAPSISSTIRSITIIINELQVIQR